MTCRWIAYSTAPLRPMQHEYSLIDQASDARTGVAKTDGEAFRIGRYQKETADTAVPLDVRPARIYSKLLEVAQYTRSGLSFGYIWASTKTAVRQGDCHPFLSGRWTHNGMISEFRRIRLILALAVAPALYAGIEGSADPQVMCFFSFTFGLTDGLHNAVARIACRVEGTAEERDIPYQPHRAVAVTGGERIWAFRYACAGRSLSLYVSTKVHALRALHPDVSFLRELSDEPRLVGLDPLMDLPGAWKGAPKNAAGALQPGSALHRFRFESADGPGPRGREPW